MRAERSFPPDSAIRFQPFRSDGRQVHKRKLLWVELCLKAYVWKDSPKLLVPLDNVVAARERDLSGGGPKPIPHFVNSPVSIA